MLTYNILNAKSTQTTKEISPTHPDNYYSREAIYKRHMANCSFKIGDKVRFKKPKRNAPTGTIIDIVTEFKDVKWTPNGASPMFIIIQQEVLNKATGAIETVSSPINMKRILYVR